MCTLNMFEVQFEYKVINASGNVEICENSFSVNKIRVQLRKMNARYQNAFLPTLSLSLSLTHKTRFVLRDIYDKGPTRFEKIVTKSADLR